MKPPQFIGLADLASLDTTSSPFSENLLGSCQESISSDNPNYLWLVKQKAQSIRLTKSSSDCDSTVGIVNMKQLSSVNLCDNPSDIWYGLKMADGTPVCIRSRLAGRQNRQAGQTAKSAKKTGKQARQTGKTRQNRQTFKSARQAGSQPARQFGVTRREVREMRERGPINYSGGFLSIASYVGKGDGAMWIYRRAGKGGKPGKLHWQRVQEKLAKARGIG